MGMILSLLDKDYCNFHKILYFTIFYISIPHPIDSFVRGVRPGHQTGFDIDDSDLLEMESCQGVVVASTIYGIDLSVHSLLHFHLVSSGL